MAARVYDNDMASPLFLEKRAYFGYMDVVLPSALTLFGLKRDIDIHGVLQRMGLNAQNITTCCALRNDCIAELKTTAPLGNITLYNALLLAQMLRRYAKSTPIVSKFEGDLVMDALDAQTHAPVMAMTL